MTAVVNFDSELNRRVGPPPLTAAVISWNGLQGNVIGTLAEIWTFGQAGGGGNLVANYFPMDSGNYRFVGSNQSGALPNTGYFESIAPGLNPGGDSRIGADYFRRYYRTAQGVGGSTFDEFVCYDPTFNGTFGGTGAVQHATEVVGFSNGAGQQNVPALGLTMGQTVWQAIFGFFDGPLTYPTPGFNAGQREDLTWALYNGNASVTETRGYLNGWGQFVALTQPNQNGRWTGYDIQIDPSYAPAALPGDGAGLTVRYGRGSPAPDPPKAGFYATMTDGNFAHGWGWDWLVSPSSGNLTKIGRLDWDAGLVLNVPISAVAGGTVPTMILGPVVDFTVAADTLIIPAKPGYSLVTVGSTAGIKAIWKTLGATAAPTISIFNNGAVPAANLVSNSALTVAGGAITTAPAFSNVQQVGAASIIDLAVGVTLRVSVAATGGACSGRIAIFGCIVPTSQIN